MSQIEYTTERVKRMVGKVHLQRHHPHRAELLLNGGETMNRYKVVGTAAECEPGSNGLVLCNRLGIKDPAVMEALERDLLLDLYQSILGKGAPVASVKISDLITWHQQWLGCSFIHSVKEMVELPVYWLT